MPVPGLTSKRIRAAKPKNKSYMINDSNPSVSPTTYGLLAITDSHICD